MVPGKGKKGLHEISYNVTDVPDLNLLGRVVMKKMGISVDKVIHSSESCHVATTHTYTHNTHTMHTLLKS